MKSTVETLSPTRVRLSVEVPFEELATHVTQAYKKVGQQVKVPGFRPGKAPRAVIDQRVGKDAIYAQATDEALPSQLYAAIRENEVRILGRPSVTEMEPIVEGKPFTFTAEVDVAPEFELPDLASLEVTVDSTEVTDEQIDAEIENLRLRFGTLKSVDRPAATGDFVTMDLRATIDGEEVEGGSTTGMSHEVGAGDLLDGLDDTLVGMKADDTKTFTTALAGGDRAGEDAEVEVKVGSVKERELPPLDDDFAQLASEHDTMDELRASTRETLAKRAEANQGRQVRENTIDALVEAIELPVPDSAIEEEVSHRVDHLRNQLSEMNLDLDTYLSSQGQTLEEYTDDQKETATVGLRRQLVLDKAAEAKEVQVSAEQLTEEIRARAFQQGVPAEQHQAFANELQKRGLLPGLTSELRRALALDEIVREVTVKDSDGNELSNEVLFPQDVEDDDADEGDEKSE
ncbi:trigger factor [Stackebrandtia nassauensis]|uniref:Trigger factor n=1 Tax=Stackebrandtia nassauensis (strain DSM 44728 / CIP 108903 / NRRL B-16338 / NBRC 102104 / LLR-40K-21) TaxID=446470 RepID=D3PV23_STANL|nr:trigger factor [Stackebrandtia nassauensis]ADD41076.1 trigger factor [Stackebrandtia nassauensis DSM 44728]